MKFFNNLFNTQQGKEKNKKLLIRWLIYSFLGFPKNKKLKNFLHFHKINEKILNFLIFKKKLNSFKSKKKKNIKIFQIFPVSPKKWTKRH